MDDQYFLVIFVIENRNLADFNPLQNKVKITNSRIGTVQII